MTHYCGHLSLIILNSPCENKNQLLESLAEFLQEIQKSSIFPASFQKATALNEEN